MTPLESMLYIGQAASLFNIVEERVANVIVEGKEKSVFRIFLSSAESSE